MKRVIPTKAGIYIFYPAGDSSFRWNDNSNFMSAFQKFLMVILTVLWVLSNLNLHSSNEGKLKIGIIFWDKPQPSFG